MTLDDLARIAAEATPGDFSARSDLAADITFAKTFNPTLCAALVEVARAASNPRICGIAATPLTAEQRADKGRAIIVLNQALTALKEAMK